MRLTIRLLGQTSSEAVPQTGLADQPQTTPSGAPKGEAAMPSLARQMGASSPRTLALRCCFRRCCRSESTNESARTRAMRITRQPIRRPRRRGGGWSASRLAPRFEFSAVRSTNSGVILGLVPRTHCSAGSNVGTRSSVAHAVLELDATDAGGMGPRDPPERRPGAGKPEDDIRIC